MQKRGKTFLRLGLMVGLLSIRLFGLVQPAGGCYGLPQTSKQCYCDGDGNNCQMCYQIYMWCCPGQCWWNPLGDPFWSEPGGC